MENFTFRPYIKSDFSACVQLFDANSPVYFAPNERDDYVSFLTDIHESYQVVSLEGRICGAFGVLNDDTHKRLNWIMIAPEFHGKGLGSAIMQRAIDAARQSDAKYLLIAASQKSAPFFEKFGAISIHTTCDGWGPGMHRVDMQLKV